MRVLVVSSYPPRHCGIGAYAATQVERLRAEGQNVTVLSPPDGGGDVRVRFFGGRPFRRATRMGGHFERIVVHFQPALYYRPRAPLSKIAASLGLLWLALRRRQTEILVHEADRPTLWRPDYLVLSAAFRAAPVVLFHTGSERQELERSYRVRVRARMVDHLEGISVRGEWSREAARDRLGIPRDGIAFVAPGFLHPDKGYERAVEALGPVAGARLYIVGSVKDRSPRNLAYAERLRGLAKDDPRVELVERYVDRDDFDAWVAAADAVVLPYRRSWSSGALARAQRLGTPAVVTAVGGLAEQASARDVVVRDDEELAAALASIASARNVRR